MSVGYTGNYTPVIQIYDRTVIAYIVVFQKQIGKMRTPFLIWFFSSKILKKLVSKNAVWFTVYIFRFFPTNDRAQPHFRIHVFMNRCRAVSVSPACQINGHTPVTVYTFVRMVNIPDLRLYL